MNLVRWNHGSHRGLALVDDPWITQVEKNPQPEDLASVLRDAPVAEVKPEQIDILRRKLVEPVRLVAATVACSRDRPSVRRPGMRRDSPGQPVSDRFNREVQALGNAPCPQPLRAQCQGFGDSSRAVQLTALRPMRQEGFEPPRP